MPQLASVGGCQEDVAFPALAADRSRLLYAMLDVSDLNALTGFEFMLLVALCAIGGGGVVNKGAVLQNAVAAAPV